jgi:hypothetical protein
VHFAGRQSSLERFTIHIGQHQHPAGFLILGDRRNESVALEIDLLDNSLNPIHNKSPIFLG